MTALSFSVDGTALLSRAACEAIFRRVVQLTAGGGETQVILRSTWTSSLRWARNRPLAAQETVEQQGTIIRQRGQVRVRATLTSLEDTALVSQVHALEQTLADAIANPTRPNPDNVPDLLSMQQYLTPALWSEATAQLIPQTLSEMVWHSVEPVVQASLTAAGHAEVGATTWGIFNTRGLTAYSTATGALYSETVLTPNGGGAGSAVLQGTDWRALDIHAISAEAQRICARSAHPVAIEPGRYTAILTPAAVGILMYQLVAAMDRNVAENGQTVYTLTPPTNTQPGVSKIGHQVIDARISVSTDPMDPEGGYLPFGPDGYPYRPVTWIANGVLQALPYGRAYAIENLGRDEALPNPFAFRMSGGSSSLDEMIATTERGILVHRFGTMNVVDPERLIVSTATRDGLFLVEGGRITQSLKHMWISEAPMALFNRVMELGRPVPTGGVIGLGFFGEVLHDLPTRALNDGRVPVVVPPVKVQDVNFTRLADAV